MESQCGDIYRIPVSEVAVAVSETGSAETASYKIHPNPFSEKLTVSTTSPFESEILLLDVTSRKILQHSFTNTSDLETENLAAGIYLFLVKDKTGIIGTGKVVKN